MKHKRTKKCKVHKLSLNLWEKLSWRKSTAKRQAIEELEMYIGYSLFGKRPIMGTSHLFFCDEKKGLKDPEKRKSIAIKGNESFCKYVCYKGDKSYYSQIRNIELPF